jgi:GNAT superfamily N-acetyltransferase
MDVRLKKQIKLFIPMSKQAPPGRLLELRQETDRVYELHQMVVRAYSVQDYLQTLPVFQRYTKQGLDVCLNSHSFCPPECREWMLDLQLRNMRDFYDASYPWSEEEKEGELFDKGSRFVIAANGRVPIGFVHFRFEQQSGQVVLFLMSVQLEPEFQKHRLGKFLVNAVEFIGLELHVHGLMTMVLKANVQGCGFFKYLKYTPHLSSPELIAPDREHRHAILFKPLRTAATH